MSSSASSLGAADIIDLDRYMRDSVRPCNPRHTRDRLVVDAGGVGVGVGGVGVRPGSSSDSGRSAGRDKRYWHDSGLSDGSCAKPRRKPHRPAVEGGGGSVREFERALRVQQQQLARVTQLCELLLHTPGAPVAPETREQPDHSTQVAKKNFGQNVSCNAPRRQRASSRSSDGSSCSSRRAHRSESCRTYDMIVSKLDELSRLFVARRAAAAPAACPAAAPAGSPAASPAACPAASPAASPAIAPPATPLVTLDATEEPSSALQALHVRRVRGARCVVARVHELDIAPRGDASSVARRSGRAPRELEDHVRLHAPHKSTPRVSTQHLSTPRASTPRASTGAQRGGSLCALCRGSWRRLARRLFGACS